MGIYFSDDGRYYTSTFSYPPETKLTRKGMRDTYAAIIIQKWWKKMLIKRQIQV